MTYREQPDVTVQNVVFVEGSSSGKAWLFRAEDDVMHEHEYWIPVSQLVETDCNAPGDSGYITIPYWLAKDKDLLE